jgi:hypothetical protein
MAGGNCSGERATINAFSMASKYAGFFWGLAATFRMFLIGIN